MNNGLFVGGVLEELHDIYDQVRRKHLPLYPPQLCPCDRLSPVTLNPDREANRTPL